MILCVLCCSVKEVAVMCTEKSMNISFMGTTCQSHTVDVRIINTGTCSAPTSYMIAAHMTDLGTDCTLPPSNITTCTIISLRHQASS